MNIGNCLSVDFLPSYIEISSGRYHCQSRIQISHTGHRNEPSDILPLVAPTELVLRVSVSSSAGAAAAAAVGQAAAAAKEDTATAMGAAAAADAAAAAEGASAAEAVAECATTTGTSADEDATDASGASAAEGVPTRIWGLSRSANSSDVYQCRHDSKIPSGWCNDH